MKLILSMIAAAIFVYVGVNFAPGINTTVATITTPTFNLGVVGMNSVILIVFAAMIIYGMLKGLEYSGNTEEESVDNYWVEYGENLKKAYTSKFGGENTGFNEEVDKRVSIMVNNGKGWTRGLAKNWLKRMHKFTEAK